MTDEKINYSELENRLKCYKASFMDETPTLVSNDQWVLQFIKDIFQTATDNVTQNKWLCEHFHRLFGQHVKFTDSAQKQLYEYLTASGAKIIKDLAKAAPPDLSGQDIPASRMVEIWGVMMKIFESTLTAKTDEINKFCAVFSTCFKSQNLALVKAAYGDWEILIDIFTLDTDWASSTATEKRSRANNSRIEFILKVLKLKNVLPQASSEVYHCWWKLCMTLKEKLPIVFDEVVHSFMRFCTGGQVRYISSDFSLDEVAAEISLPLSENSPLISFTTIQWDPNSSYVRTSLPHLPELIPKLLQLLNNLIASDDYSSFMDRNVLNCHSLYVFQCIRFISKQLLPDDPQIDVIPTLIWKLAFRINKVLENKKRTDQIHLFIIQLKAWIGEGQHKTAIYLNTLKKLIEKDVFSNLTDGTAFWEEFLLPIRQKSVNGLAPDQMKSDELFFIYCQFIGKLKLDQQSQQMEDTRRDAIKLLRKLYDDKSMDLPAFWQTWKRLAEFFGTISKKTSDESANSIEHNSIILDFYTLPLHIVVIADDPNLELDTLVLRKLKALYTVFQKKDSSIRLLEHRFYNRLLNRIRSEAYLEKAAKNPALLYLISSYVAAVVESAVQMSFKATAAAANKPKMGLELEQLCLLTHIRPVVTFLVDFVKTVEKASWSIEVTGAEPTLQKQSQAYDSFIAAMTNTVKMVNAILCFLRSRKDNLMTRQLLIDTGSTIGLILKVADDKRFFALVKFAANDVSFNLKEIAVTEFETMINNLQQLFKIYGGKVDSSLLREMSSIFISGFKHSSNKICVAICDLWRVSFEQAKDLDYPAELKGVLTTHAKKLKLQTPNLDIESPLVSEVNSPIARKTCAKIVNSLSSSSDIIDKKRVTRSAAKNRPQTSSTMKSSNIQSITPNIPPLVFDYDTDTTSEKGTPESTRAITSTSSTGSSITLLPTFAKNSTNSNILTPINRNLESGSPHKALDFDSSQSPVKSEEVIFVCDERGSPVTQAMDETKATVDAMATVVAVTTVVAENPIITEAPIVAETTVVAEDPVMAVATVETEIAEVPVVAEATVVTVAMVEAETTEVPVVAEATVVAVAMVEAETTEVPVVVEATVEAEISVVAKTPVVAEARDRKTCLSVAKSDRAINVLTTSTPTTLTASIIPQKSLATASPFVTSSSSPFVTSLLTAISPGPLATASSSLLTAISPGRVDAVEKKKTPPRNLPFPFEVNKTPSTAVANDTQQQPSSSLPSTPGNGILKKVDSPATSGKKHQHVQFELDNEEDGPSTPKRSCTSRSITSGGIDDGLVSAFSVWKQKILAMKPPKSGADAFKIIQNYQRAALELTEKFAETSSSKGSSTS